jgi:ACS family hexuronate transporter-like MFS transporter
MVFSEGSNKRTVSQAPAWAWGLCWLMFASTVLNYMDRQAVALVGTKLKAEFAISNEGFGWVQAAFYLTYALFQVPAGYIADRGNVRWTYAMAVGVWSLAGIAAALAPSLSLLLICRAILGIGESFNWPCALRATAAALPPADRSLGNGIFNSGAAVGAVLTPLTIPVLTQYFGWRVAFAVVGVLGFVWVAVWLRVLTQSRSLQLDKQSKAEHAIEELSSSPSVGLSVKASVTFLLLVLVSAGIILSAFEFGRPVIWPGFGRPAIWWGIAVFMFGILAAARILPLNSLTGTTWARSLGEIVRLRRFWVLVVVSISVNVCWHFLVYWMATYFQEDRRLGILAGGMVSALPFFAADFGNLGGGALSRFLVGLGTALNRSRIIVIGVSALLISCGVWVGVLQNDVLIIVSLAIMAFGAAAYMANYFAFGQEVSARNTGLVVGLLGGLGNLFAAGFLPIAGRIKDVTGGFGLSFLIVGLMPLIGVVALVVGWGPSERSQESA